MVADPHIHDAEGGADRRRFHAHGVGAAGADLCGARPAAVPDRTGRDHADRIELHILDAHTVLRLSGGGQAWTDGNGRGWAARSPVRRWRAMRSGGYPNWSIRATTQRAWPTRFPIMMPPPSIWGRCHGPGEPKRAGRGMR